MGKDLKGFWASAVDIAKTTPSELKAAISNYISPWDSLKEIFLGKSKEVPQSKLDDEHKKDNDDQHLEL